MTIGWVGVGLDWSWVGVGLGWVEVGLGMGLGWGWFGVGLTHNTHTHNTHTHNTHTTQQHTHTHLNLGGRVGGGGWVGGTDEKSCHSGPTNRF